MRAHKAANKRFENFLDVQSLFETHLNLKLYLDLVLTEPQKLIFKHHRDRAVSLSEDSDQTGRDYKAMDTKEFSQALT